eukprot:227177_1
MAGETARIAICIALFIIDCVLSTCMIYTIYLFYSKSERMLIQKRNPIFTIIHSTFLLIVVGFHNPFYVLYFSQFDEQLSSVIYNIVPFYYPILLHSITWGFALKYYLLYFEINWIKATQSHEWKMHLNEKEYDSNFFISNKYKFGCLRFCAKIAIAIIIVCVVMQWIFDLSLGRGSVMNTIARICLILLPTIFISILWCMTPKFFDNFYIVQEYRWIIILGGLYLLTYLLMGISPWFGASVYIRKLLGNIHATVGGFVIGMFQLVFSLKKLENDTTNNYNNTDNNMKRIKLFEILSHSDLTNAFMTHLLKEFSVEIGLAYIEFVQFKWYFAETIFEKKETREALVDEQICIINNEEITKSIIVFGNDNINLKEFQEKAYLLYKKYVDYNGSFQINLSHVHRSKLDAVLKDIVTRSVMNEKELYCVFDDAIQEMWKLMVYSCNRFTLSNV